MILSYHPLIEGHENRLTAHREPDEGDREAIRAADAVILPQGFRPSWWAGAFVGCGKAFPDYRLRFPHPGKTGQARLFAELGLPHPRTVAFGGAKEFSGAPEPPFGYPCVFKPDWGGEGEGVALTHEPKDVARLLSGNAGRGGFVLQEFVPSGGRTLRVAVVGDQLAAYWKVAPVGAPLRAGIASGGSLDRESDPGLMEKGVEAARDFCGRTGVNLAGLDFLFPLDRDTPLLLEINWFFGRRGLGGSDRFYELLARAVDRWLVAQGLPPLPGA
ncbi:MAG: glutathione synthase [Pseudomonadota bacterium]